MQADVAAALFTGLTVEQLTQRAGVITVSPLTFGANVPSVTTQFDPVAQHDDPD